MWIDGSRLTVHAMVMSPATIALAVAVVFALGEWLHARRIRRVARLAFADGVARPWTMLAAPLRIAGAALCSWGLATLLLSASADLAGSRREAAARRLVVALDVSPSMDLIDAGPDGRSSRARRAREVLNSLLARADVSSVRISVVALYTGAKPVVVDTIDPEVVRNVLDDLPLDFAFDAGPTELYASLATCAELARGTSVPGQRPDPWPPGQARLIVVSDGDSLPPTAAVHLPSAFAGALVIGIGDPVRGTNIAGHQSRQEAGTLRQLAGRLGGAYHDGNRRQVPSEMIAELLPVRGDHQRSGLGDLAIAAVAVGASLLALLPVALACAGAGHPLPPLRSIIHVPPA